MDSKSRGTRAEVEAAAWTRLEGIGPDPAAEDLLRQVRQLKESMASFARSARAFLAVLDPQVSDEEAEAMISPAANIMGALACLLADDFEPAFRKLIELDGLLATTDAEAGSQSE
jgi:hypothetical protein